MPTYSAAEQARQRAAISPATQWRRESENWFDGSVESVDSRLAACDRLLADARGQIAHDGFGSGSRKHLAAIEDLEAQREVLIARRDMFLTAGTSHYAVDATPSGGFGNTVPMTPGTADKAVGGNPGMPDVSPPQGGAPVFGPWETGGGYPGFDQSKGIPSNGAPAVGGSSNPGNISAGLIAADRRYVELESAKFIRANSDCPVDELAIRARHHAEVKTSTFTQQRSRAVTAAFVQRVAQLRRAAPRPRVAMASPRSMDFPPEMMFL